MSWVSECKIPFHTLPIQTSHPKLHSHPVEDIVHIANQIQKLRADKVISFQFLSPYFVVDKSSGGKRFVLNLKQLNQYVETPHFKMEDARTALKLVFKNCYTNTNST